jgi:diguanylate cyclase (GGDEF)-like protein
MIPTAKPKKTQSTWLLEAILGLAAITAVNLLLYRQDLGFSRAVPHPYWAVIILMAARYGFRAGMVSGVLAGVLYFVLRAQAVDSLNVADLKSFSLWGRPILFAAVGVLLGELRQQQIKKYKNIESKFLEQKHELQRLQQQYEALSTAKQEIDMRIVSQEQTLSTLYEAAHGLRSLEEKDIYPAVLAMLHDHLKVEDSGIYLIEGDQLRLKARLGSLESQRPKTLPLASSMFSQAITQHEAVSLDMVLEEKPNDDSPLAVAPVMGLAGRRVLGVLAVWSMPFIKFTPDSVNMIALMADWCGESVDNARVYQQTKDKLIADETIDAYTPEYLRQRLNEEFTRARRYNLSLSLLVLEFPKFQGVSDEDREDVLLTLSLVLKNWTRNIDLLFLGDTPGLFVLLLPNTNLEGARVVARNIMNTFESLKEGMNEQDTALQDIHSGVSAFTPEMKNAEEMLTAAQENASHALHLD